MLKILSIALTTATIIISLSSSAKALAPPLVLIDQTTISNKQKLAQEQNEYGANRTKYKHGLILFTGGLINNDKNSSNNAIQLGGGYSYGITEKIQLQATGVYEKYKDTDAINIAGGFQYRFLQKKITPYIASGVSSTFSDLENYLSVYVGAGADVFITKKTAINAEIKADYTFSDTINNKVGATIGIRYYF